MKYKIRGTKDNPWILYREDVSYLAKIEQGILRYVVTEKDIQKGDYMKIGKTYGELLEPLYIATDVEVWTNDEKYLLTIVSFVPVVEEPIDGMSKYM